MTPEQIAALLADHDARRCPSAYEPCDGTHVLYNALLAHIDTLTAAVQNGLTRATAKGTAIDVDEWGRELYVVDAAVLAILRGTPNR